MRSGRVICAILGLFLALLPQAGAFAAGPPIEAEGAVHGQVVSAAPAAASPHVLDGQVRSVAVVGDLVVLGGEFTQVSSPDGSIVYERANLVAFDKHTGAVSQTFTPAADGMVERVIPAPDGTSILVGGHFDTIDGQGPRTLARLNLADGSPTAGFTAPDLNGRIKDMEIDTAGRLWIVGNFEYIQGSRQPAVATLDPDTGDFDPFMRLEIAEPRQPGQALQAVELDISAAGDQVAVVGNFTSINSLGRHQIGLLDIAGATATLADWSTDFYTSPCDPGFETYMRDVDFAPDGSWMAVVVAGGYATPPAACTSTARFDTATTGTGIEPTWVNYTGGDTLTAVEATDTAVYVGGHFRWQNNPYGDNTAGRGAVSRPGLAALDPAGGSVYAWNPTRTLGIGVFDLQSTPDGLWMGSDTDQTGGVYRGRVAFFPLDGGTVPPDPTPAALPADLYTLPTTPGDELTRSAFDGTTPPGPGEPVDTPDQIDWTTIRGAFAVAGHLYTADTNGDLTRRRYDGIGFGPGQPVDAADQIEQDLVWHNDLANLTAMAPTDGRIYYTRNGINRLWSRAFTPESGIVGAQRATAHTGQTDLDWSLVRGMTISGDTLYYGYASTPASLRKVDFTNGQPTGPIEVITTAAEYDTRGMFLHPSPAETDPVQLVDTAATNANHTSLTLTIPDTITNGDQLLLFATLNATDRTLTGPVGGPTWTPVVDQATNGQITHLWQAEAGPDDAGTTITLNLNTTTKAALTLAAYRPTNPDNPLTIRDHTIAPETQTTTDHTTPTIHNPHPDTRLISYWGEKSSGTTQWTPPDGHAVRNHTYGEGGGRIATLLTDSDQPIPPGPVGGLTATTNYPSAQATMITILLGPTTD